MEPFCVASVDGSRDASAIRIRVQCGHPSEHEQWGARAQLSPSASGDRINDILKNVRESLIAVIPQRLWSEMATLIDDSLKPLRAQIEREHKNQ
jgi:hypothetical protein